MLASVTLPLAVQGGAPEWIELIPAGPTVTGYDGRSWRMADPAAVVSATLAVNRPMPVDWEHATQVRAEKGEEAPAAGWIKGLEVRAGAIWGRVEWTPRAANQVSRREYRFVSPVFQYTRAAPNDITGLVSVGLTNTPNLTLTALNSRQEVYIGREPTATEMKVAHLFNMDPRRLARNSGT